MVNIQCCWGAGVSPAWPNVVLILITMKVVILWANRMCCVLCVVSSQAERVVSLCCNGKHYSSSGKDQIWPQFADDVPITIVNCHNWFVERVGLINWLISPVSAHGRTLVVDKHENYIKRYLRRPGSVTWTQSYRVIQIRPTGESNHVVTQEEDE